MSLRNFIHKLKSGIKGFQGAYKYGGEQRLNVSYLQHGDLLKDKIVLVTGGGTGIGKAICKSALKQGATVVICGRREEKLKETIAEFEKMGLAKVHFITMDVANIKDIPVFIDKVINVVGRIDILINNAGIQPRKFFPNVTEDEWDRIYETNSKGTFFMCQEFCKYWKKMSEENTYKIINLSSQGGFVGATYPYRMSKWDIVGLTEGLGKLMANKRIIVNSIAPGVVLTDMQSKYYDHGDNVYCEQNPMRRFALPEEIAELAVFLMSDLSNFITGQTILIDGGFTLK